MKYFVAMSVVILMSGLAHAKIVNGVNCDNAMNQTDMNMCAGATADEADAKLNKAFNELKSLNRKDRPSLNALIKAERAWIVYRDAQCESETIGSTGGSIHPLEVASCDEEKAVARTKELKKMIAELKNM